MEKILSLFPNVVKEFFYAKGDRVY